MRELHDVEYAKAGGISLRLDLYLPAGETRPHPVVVWIHGGGWNGGDKTHTVPTYMTEKGLAAASISYRFSDVAAFPAQLHDCKAALRWLRANAKKYGLDAGRIGAWGESAGGHLAILLGTTGHVKELEGEVGVRGYPSSVQAVCDWCGPTDFLQLDAHAAPNPSLVFASPDSPVSRLLGGPLLENRDKAEAASPLRYVRPGMPPFLIMHGEKDASVPIHQSELLYERLKQVGCDVTFRRVPDGGHVFRSEVQEKVVEQFFRRCFP